MDKHEIKITCKGAELAPLDKLFPLQGDLKRLPREKMDKLKRSLIKYGFSFPFFAWANRGKFWILDGHQRDTALRSLAKDGYIIPPLPIALVDAKDEREAKEKILLISSQFGEITERSPVYLMTTYPPSVGSASRPALFGARLRY